MMTSLIDRRRLILTSLAGTVAFGTAMPASALTEAQARDLITRAVADVHRIINSGQAEARMIREFEALFRRYGDVPTIARSALGPAARSASPAQLSAFTEAFSGYLARKYGRQFRVFEGARAEVTHARAVQSFWEVSSTMTLRNQPPFEVRWQVSDRSGQNLFFNLIIEGVNVLAAERQEIGSMLDRRGGNVDRLIADLRQAG